MAGSPNARMRGRIELLLRVAGPLLDAVLAVAERLSRVLDPDDPDYVPARTRHAGESAPRGLSGYPPREASGR